MCSRYTSACSVFNDEDHFTEDSSSGRESTSSISLETDLDVDENFENLLESTNNDNGRVLYLKACQILCVVPIKRLLHQLRSKEICINHRNLNDIDCKAISNALLVNKTVTTLDLSNNLISDKGALYLGSAIVQNDVVRVLVLARNKLSYNSAEIFAELLQRSKTLSVLDLSGNGFDDKGCAILAEAIKDSKTLEQCNLSQNKLTEKAGSSLGDALACNDRLQHLNLSWNLLRHGLASIATGLSTNHTLQILDLSWNGIDDAGVRALFKGLETNTNLEDLNLSRNNISDLGFLEIVKVLERCHLQKLNISRNRCFGSNEALGMLLKLLQEEKIRLKIVNIGQIPLTKETAQLLAELKTSRADVSIYHGYTTEDSYQATAPKNTNPCEILREYAITHQLHSFQFFRALGQSDVYRETISRDDFVIGLTKLNVFDDHQINDVINILDRDRNGVIDYSEFMAIF